MRYLALFLLLQQEIPPAPVISPAEVQLELIRDWQELHAQIVALRKREEQLKSIITKQNQELQALKEKCGKKCEEDKK